MKSTMNFYQPWVFALSLLWISFSFIPLSAQVIIDESFEYDCADGPSNAFFDGCFEGWTATHGTPSAEQYSSNTGIMPFDGEWFMHGYLKYGHCNSEDSRAEGIAINYSFKAGVTYALSYAYLSTGVGSYAPHNLTRNTEWLLHKSLPNKSGGFCQPNELVPDVVTPLQLVHAPEDVVDEWTYYSNIQFTPTQNFSQLWFRSEYDVPGANSIQALGDYYLDDVTIEVICDPVTETPEFNFESANLLSSEEFCFPDEVFIDWSANETADQFQIVIDRRMIGSSTYEPFAEIDWMEGSPETRINLSALLAEQGIFLDPGYEYQVEFYTGQQDCRLENPAIHSFTVVCCEAFSAEFYLSMEESSGGLSLHVDGFYSSLDEDITNQWIVISSPNENTGPYTLEASLTTTASGSVTVLEGAQAGLYYTVVHRLQTPCGEFCFGKQRFGQNGEPGRTDEPDCEYCGPFACEIINELCFPATGLSATQYENGAYLDWDPHFYAEEYILELNINDPACCVPDGAAFTLTFPVYQDEFYIPFYLNCFSFRVGVLCGDGYVWSEPECFQYHRHRAKDKGDQRTEKSDGIDELWKPWLVYPNPVIDMLTVQFENPFTGELRLYDSNGQMVIQQAVQAEATPRVDMSALTPGMYWLTYANDSGVGEPIRVVKASN